MTEKLRCQECGAQSLPLPMRNRDGAHVCIPCFLKETNEDERVLARYRALLKRQTQARRNFRRQEVKA